ncbi:MAG: hypothetical protein Kow0075_08690 [Salibacteraceae bacterium]
MATGSKLNTITPPAEEFFDLSYADEPAELYHLYGEIDDDELKAAWFHTSKKLVTGFASYELSATSLDVSLIDLLSKKTFLTSPFGETIITSATDRYTILPREISEDQQSAFAKNLLDFDAHTEVLCSYALVTIPANIVMVIGRQLHDAIHQKLVAPRILPAMAPLLERGALLLKHRTNQSLVMLHIGANHVHLALFDKGMPQLCNAYYQCSKEDVAYYLLYAAELCNIDPENAPLFVSGRASVGDETWRLLSTYWKNIYPSEPAEGIQISEKLGTYPTTKFEYLTNHLLCAS